VLIIIKLLVLLVVVVAAAAAAAAVKHPLKIQRNSLSSVTEAFVLLTSVYSPAFLSSHACYRMIC
jgi:hypothetical protein